MRLFHGSEFIIEKPEFGKGFAHNDYGKGFYTTQSQGLAGEWAVLRTARDGYINEYFLHKEKLNVLELDSENTLEWLAILLAHRKVQGGVLIARGQKAFVQKYGVDLSSYDVIKGWRADDSYFNFARGFLFGLLSVEGVKRALRLGNLGEQICIKSKLAFDNLEFLGERPATVEEHYTKAKKRDSDARKKCAELLDTPWAGEGTTIRDLVGVTNASI